MGASSSKAARTAKQMPRKYPTRTSPLSNPTSTSPAAPAADSAIRNAQKAREKPLASDSKDSSISMDGQDPTFAASLRSLGAVDSSFGQPSHSSIPPSTNPSTATSNPAPQILHNAALDVLSARAKINREAEEEFSMLGRKGYQGRRYLDAVTIRQIISMRDENRKSAESIERDLGLRRGVVDKLGGIIVGGA